MEPIKPWLATHMFYSAFIYTSAEIALRMIDAIKLFDGITARNYINHLLKLNQSIPKYNGDCHTHQILISTILP